MSHPILQIAVPGPTRRSEPTGRTRAPWAFWGLDRCGESTILRAHRWGHREAHGSACRVSGCPRCHPAARAASLAGLDGLVPKQGRRWYLATLTPPARIRDYDDRDGWLMDLRAAVAGLIEEGVWDGAICVIETTGRTEKSRQPCPARLAWWDGGSEEAVRAGIAWEARCLAGGCPICGGAGVLPVGHLHAHLLVLARPFYSGRTAPDWAIRRGLTTRSRYGEPPRSWTRTTIAEDGARTVDRLESPEIREGTWSYFESRGFPITDMQAVSRKDAAKAYLSKLVRDYVAKVKKTKEEPTAELARDDAILLAAWMAGRRSLWAQGCLYGLAGASKRSLAWETVAVCVDDPGLPAHEKEDEKGRLPDERIVLRRETRAFRALAQGAGPLGLSDGVKCRRAERGTVHRAGSTFPSILVGDSIVGSDGEGARPPRETVARAVERGWSRWVRGQIGGEWVAWWDAAAPVLGLPPAPASWRAQVLAWDRLAEDPRSGAVAIPGDIVHTELPVREYAICLRARTRGEGITRKAIAEGALCWLEWATGERWTGADPRWRVPPAPPLPAQIDLPIAAK